MWSEHLHFFGGTYFRNGWRVIDSIIHIDGRYFALIRTHDLMVASEIHAGLVLKRHPMFLFVHTSCHVYQLMDVLLVT